MILISPKSTLIKTQRFQITVNFAGINRKGWNENTAQQAPYAQQQINKPIDKRLMTSIMNFKAVG